VSTLLLYVLLLRATVMSFSGFASVPLVREDLVARRAILSDEQLNGAIAISQASPGPLGLYIVIVGYFVAGVPGAVAGMLALATPALLAIPILRIVRRGSARTVRNASSGIVIASSVLMLTTGARLAPQATPSLPFMAVAVAGFIALATGRVPPAIVVVVAAVIGLFLV
jgi:chromate transporter